MEVYIRNSIVQLLLLLEVVIPATVQYSMGATPLALVAGVPESCVTGGYNPQYLLLPQQFSFCLYECYSAEAAWPNQKTLIISLARKQQKDL